MSLPANDAFSLGLAHDQPRHSSSRVPRRSSSPILSFSSLTQPSSAQPLPKRAHRRNASHQQLAAVEPVEEVDTRISRDCPASHKAANNPIDWEIPRKALHSSIGFLTIYLYISQGNPQTVVIALSSALAVLVPVDVLRLRYSSFERLFEKCVWMFMRDSEKKSVNGVIWYLLGVNTALIAFPLDIAVVSILILSWADTAASTFGRLWGRLTPPLSERLFGLPLAPHKSLAGFIAATVTGAAVAAGFWTYIAPFRDDLTWTLDAGVCSMFSGGSMEGGKVFSGRTGLAIVTVWAGLISGVAEALDLGAVDDNLTLPIIAGGCLCGLFKVLGWLGDMLA